MLRRKLALLCLLVSGASGNVAVAQDFSAQNSGVIAPSAPDWTRTYSPDITYRNVTDGVVNIRLGAGMDHTSPEGSCRGRAGSSSVATTGSIGAGSPMVGGAGKAG